MQFIVLALASLAVAGPVLENRQAPPSYGGHPEDRPAPPSYGGHPEDRPAPPSYGGHPEDRPAPPSYGGYPEDRPAPPAYDPVTIGTRTTVSQYPSATFATRTSAAPSYPTYDDEEPPVATRPSGETCPTVPASTVYITRPADSRPTGCTTITTITVTSVVPRPQPTGGDNGDNDDGDENDAPPAGNPAPAPPAGNPVPAPPVRPIRPCSGPFTPRCCQLDVLGVAALTCNSVPRPITSLDNFDAQCAATGTTAQCCLLPVLGQGLICNDP